MPSKSAEDRSAFETKLAHFVDDEAELLVKITQDLIRLPSENTPPVGAEELCQRYVSGFLKDLGLMPNIFSPEEVPGIRNHPLFLPGRTYHNRPNVAVRILGAGKGRSLILSGHIDTVPQGTQPWTRRPFGGEREGNRLFGRGSNDMKAGIATNLFVCAALAKLGLRLRGDLIFESIVDEEFGGSNGTLASRLCGFNANAAVISEPSSLRICPAQRGGRTAHIVLESEGCVLNDAPLPGGVIQQLTYFLAKVKEFATQRKAKAPEHELYRSHSDPVPVTITKVVTGPWGTREPITVPEQCQIEMYWQTMPGESQAEIEQEFFQWLSAMATESNGIFKTPPAVSFPIRWLPGSAVSTAEPIVRELAACAQTLLSTQPVIAGIEGPCDLYIFQQGFNIPAVLWGARGGNTHNADEYVEIDSIVSAAKTLLLFVCRWCGVLEA